MPTKYQRPTKKQKEYYENMLSTLRSGALDALTRKSYSNALSFCRDFYNKIDLSYHDKKITYYQYRKLKSQLNLFLRLFKDFFEGEY